MTAETYRDRILGVSENRTVPASTVPIITPTTINWRLKAITDAPVRVGDTVFTLHYAPDKSKNGGSFILSEVSW